MLKLKAAPRVVTVSSETTPVPVGVWPYCSSDLSGFHTLAFTALQHPGCEQSAQRAATDVWHMSDVAVLLDAVLGRCQGMNPSANLSDIYPSGLIDTVTALQTKFGCVCVEQSLIISCDSVRARCCFIYVVVMHRCRHARTPVATAGCEHAADDRLDSLFNTFAWYNLQAQQVSSSLRSPA